MGCLVVVLGLPMMVAATPVVLVWALISPGGFVSNLDRGYGHIGAWLFRRLGLAKRGA